MKHRSFTNSVCAAACSAIVAALIAAAMTLPGQASPTDRNENPGIVPPNAHFEGRSYAEWSEVWWQYAYSIPLTSVSNGEPNPLFDPTGAYCHVGQSGDVLFLVGLYNNPGSVTRSCTVDAGTFLFFPMLNTEMDNVGAVPPLTIPQLYAALAAQFTPPPLLHATIDGRPVDDPLAYQAISEPFTYFFPPPPNIASLFNLTIPAAPVFPAVANGFWLALYPLPPGSHTLNFGGKFNKKNALSLSVTYHLTVLARPCSQSSSRCARFVHR